MAIYMQFPSPATISGGTITVTGEVTDPTHSLWVAVKSFDLGIESPATLGSTTGKASFPPVTIRKYVDSASPSLFSAAAYETHFPTVNIAISKPGTALAADYAIYTLRYVIITQVEWSAGSSDENVAETLTMIYGAMQVSYAKLNPDGTVAKPVTAMWNAILNNASTTVPA